MERAIAPMERDVGGDEVVPLPPRVPAQERKWDGEETSSCFAAEVVESSDDSPWQRRKQRVNWTFALEELAGKRRLGGNP